MDDPPSQDQDFSKLSIEDRVLHKNWKARISGYEELIKLFPQYESDREFQRYSPLIKKFVIDTNAAAQEKGLAATLSYVDYCPHAGKYVENILAGITTKCLAAQRAKTKELASDIVLMCIEIERQDVVVDELVKALEQKTPKNVAATIVMIRKCLNQFGSKVISLKPIVPILSRFLEERDLNVREETKQLTIEIYRWIKDALLPQLTTIKPILLQELQLEFDKCKDLKATPERLLRSQQQRQHDDNDGNQNDNNGGGDNGGTSTEDCDNDEIDPFDLLEPFDLLSKLPTDFYTMIEAKKWSERKDGLEKLQQLLDNNPKLQTSDYSELIKQLKKIIAKDTNIVVVTLAIKCLGQLSQGLRKSFHNYAQSSISVLLEKFKEKKQNVVQSLRDAIDAVYLTTNLEAINEDVIASLDNKNPSIRSETALFLSRCFTKTNPHTIQKKLLKTLVTSLLKTLSDSDSTVRESSAEAIGTALKAQGDRNMAPLLQGLEQLKMTKIEEYRDKAEVKKFSAPPPPPTNNNNQQKSTTTGKPKPVNKKPRPVAKNVSNESLDDDLDQVVPPPSSSQMKVKSKIGGGTAKSRIAGSAGSSSDNNNNNNNNNNNVSKTVRSGGAMAKTSSGSRLGVGGGAPSIKKGSSTSNLRAGSNGISSESGSASSLSTTASKKSSHNDSIDSHQGGPLMNGQLKWKEQRFADEKALKVLRWNFTTPRDEFYQLLREQMTTAEWQTQLITNCFHSDFKYHIKAIDMMRDFFQKNSSNDNPVVIANLDLILKWIALRFFDTNPSVITKALELLLILFTICNDQYQYQLSDMEANSFLPYLVLKFGDPKDAVRNKVHDIIAKIRNIYSPAKIFGHLFTGLQSKNSRQRATCLEEIGQLIEQRGMSIFQQASNNLQMIKDLAKFIAERDNAVRNGALTCIVQVYFLEGERVFKLIGSLSDKEMSLVEERIKRASKNRPPPPQCSEQPSNGGASSSGLPTLFAQQRMAGVRSGSGGGGGIVAPTDLEGFKTMSSPSYDIGATMTKPTSSNLLRRNQSGGNFTPSSRLRSLQQQQQQPQPSGLKFFTPPPPSTTTTQQQFTMTTTTTDNDGYDDNNMINNNNDNNNNNNNNDGGSGIISSNDNQLTTDTSDVVYSTDDDDNNDLQQRIKQALNSSTPAESIRYRRGVNRSSPSTAAIRSSSSDSSTNGHHNQSLRRMMNGHHRTSNSQLLNPELQKRFNHLFQQLGSTDLQQAIEAAELLNVALKDQQQFRPYMEPKIDQLIILSNKQFRLFLSQHYPSASNESANDEQKNDEEINERRERAVHLFRTITSLLNKVFRSSLGKLISRDTLRELITHLLSYFADGDVRQNNQTIFNSTNYLFNIIMTGADATNLISALIRLLHDYVGSPNVEQQSDKYLDITMKFLWRITKTLEKYYYPSLNIDQILLEAHLFFKSYPRSWWQLNHKRDDLPSRTIKTLVFFIVKLKRESILDHFTLIQNKDESELSYYVQKALRQKFDKSSSSSSTSSTAATVTNNNLSITSNDNSSIVLNGSNNSNSNQFKENDDQQSSSCKESSDPYPLRLKQIHNDNTDTVMMIPIIENEKDFQIYCEYTAKQLKIKDLNYDKFQQQQQHTTTTTTKIRNVEDARRAVELAKQRLEHFRSYLSNNDNN